MTTQQDGRSWRGNVPYDQIEGNCRIEGDALIDGTLGCRIAFHDLDSQGDFRVQQRYSHQFTLFPKRIDLVGDLFGRHDTLQHLWKEGIDVLTASGSTKLCSFTVELSLLLNCSFQ